MMDAGFSFTASKVRDLTGPALKCLILLILSGKPENQEYLIRFSGLSPKTVARALQRLQDDQLITRNNRYAWQLSIYASQLPLSMPALTGESGGTPEEKSSESSSALSGEAHLAENAETTTVADDSQIDGSQAHTRRDTENFRIDTEIFPIDTENFRIPRPSSSRSLIKDSRINMTTTTRADTENFRILLETLDRYGIYDPPRTELARLPHVTPELIEYHCITCPPPNTGLAIYRIRHNYRIPRGWQPPLADVGWVSEPTGPSDPEDAAPAGIVHPAWIYAVDQLLQEIGYEGKSYLENTILLAYDPEANHFAAGAANKFAVEWLDGRLTTTIKRILAGFTGREAQITWSVS
jgi:hypothetical protein